ncbi:MAG TPA: hypothetical protein VMF89_34325 [Polyangiales bacterium]|nr:hypothetical protein [Polyangiales bacterium]
MLRRRQFLVASFALTFSVMGCAAAAEKKVAALCLDRHFSALKSRTFETALADYDKHFFSEVTRAEWRVALVSVVDKLGSFQRYKITSSGLSSKEVAGPGYYLRFQLAVTYSKHPSDETFYLFRKEGSKRYKIVGHQIDADGLNK